MKQRRKPWIALLAVFLCLLCAGITVTGDVVRREGWEGLFKRKRDAVRPIMPEAVPLVDEIEKRVRKGD